MRTGTVAALLLTAGLLGVACDRDNKHRPGQSGAVGTSGRSDMTVAEALTGTPIFVGRDAESAKLWQLTRQFYQKRGNEPAWIENRKPSRQMDELIGALQAADREGLDPALYNVSLLTAKRQEAGRGFLTAKGFDPAEASKLDVWLTYLYLSFASDLSTGIADLSHADPNWKIRDEKLDLRALLEKSLEENRIGPKHCGVFGRRAGSLPGFDYSPAMRRSKIVWNEKTLD